MIAKISQLIGKKGAWVWCDSDTEVGEEGYFLVASLQMANQIGLDAGLMSAAAWVGQCLALPAMIANSGIDRIHTHTHDTRF